MIPLWLLDKNIVAGFPATNRPECVEPTSCLRGLAVLMELLCFTICRWPNETLSAIRYVPNSFSTDTPTDLSNYYSTFIQTALRILPVRLAVCLCSLSHTDSNFKKA